MLFNNSNNIIGEWLWWSIGIFITEKVKRKTKL